MNSIVEYYNTYDNPITDMQRNMLLLLMDKTGIQVDIDSLTYGSAAETIYSLFKDNR